jgi:hypothetical protein
MCFEIRKGHGYRALHVLCRGIGVADLLSQVFGVRKDIFGPLFPFLEQESPARHIGFGLEIIWERGDGGYFRNGIERGLGVDLQLSAVE